MTSIKDAVKGNEVRSIFVAIVALGMIAGNIVSVITSVQ